MSLLVGSQSVTGQRFMASSVPVVIAGDQSVILVNADGTKITYSASITALAPAAGATDIFGIVGSVTKLVKVSRIQISGVATAAAAVDVQLIKRSSADTVGTFTLPIMAPHDSLDPPATAVVGAYTANPAVGIAVGTLQSRKITLSTAAGAIPIVPTVFDFGTRGEKRPALRNAGESIYLNWNGQTVAGSLLNIDITWTEE